MALLKLSENEDHTIGELLLKVEGEVLGVSAFENDQVLVTFAKKISLIQVCKSFSNFD